MIERNGPVRNPLTIIAIFAGIAEVSGAVVLPHVPATSQPIFVWFLILFPSVLVLLFFVTLNLNHKVLYAPSDFENEDNFFRDASPAEAAAKVGSELQPAKGAKAPAAQNSVPDVEFEGMTANAWSSFAWARDMVFARLSAELRVPIRRSVRGKRDDDRWYVFDGIINYRAGSVTAVEFMYVIDGDLLGPLSAARAREVQAAWNAMPESLKRGFDLIIAVGTNARLCADDRLVGEVRRSMGNMPFSVTVRLFDLAELAVSPATGA